MRPLKRNGEPTEKVGYAGGPGLLSIGQSVEATFLEPGRYVIEYYVRTPERVQQLGMMRELIISEEDDSTSPPEPDDEIVLTNDFIKAADSYDSGTYTFKVDFREHPVGYVGNDVHLVRLENENPDLEEKTKWKDVRLPEHFWGVRTKCQLMRRRSLPLTLSQGFMPGFQKLIMNSENGRGSEWNSACELGFDLEIRGNKRSFRRHFGHDD